MKGTLNRMDIYQNVMKNGSRFYHARYCLYHSFKTTVYDSGTIRRVSFNTDESKNAFVTVHFENGDVCEWRTKWIDIYISQFGIAVSNDGRYIFAQTWENGLLCLDARTGKKVWKTKSRRGVTNIFVNDNTVLCHRHGYALQLLNIHTGEVLAEKRPATAWGFTAINHQYIICQVTARRWEVIDAETMETKQAISDRNFTDGNLNFCVNQIELLDKNTLKI